MLNRLRPKQDDEGFTLIELLVVMIIIGILAAIAIPVFLNQRKKAQDSSAKADVSTIGKELATYWVDNTAAPTALTIDANKHYLLATPGGNIDMGKASTGNLLGGTLVLTNTTAAPWCVFITNDAGDKAKTGYKYSAVGGLAEGVCT